MQDTRTPFLINCFENAVNVVAALLLFDAMGLPGLALSFSIAYASASVVSLAVMSRRLGGLRGRQVGSTFARVLLVGAAVAVVTWAIADRLGSSTPTEAILTCAVAGTAGVVVAVVGLWAMRIHEYHDLRDAFRRGAGRGAVVSR